MKAINIKWDIDENCDLDMLQMLPDEIEIPDAMIDDESIGDYISNKTGFCHNGFELKGPSSKKDEDLLIKISNLCYEASEEMYETPEMEKLGILSLCDQLTECIDKFLERNDYEKNIDQDEIDLE